MTTNLQSDLSMMLQELGSVGSVDQTLSILVEKLGHALQTLDRSCDLNDGGLGGMQEALDTVITVLSDALAERDRGRLSPLIALSMRLQDWKRGVEPPALRKVSTVGGNQHSQYAVELKARSLVISEFLQLRGAKKSEADAAVLERVRAIAPMVGITIGSARSETSIVSTMENWRRDFRRRRAGDCSPNSLSSRVRCIRDHVVELQYTERPAPEFMDMVLNMPPAMTPMQLMHLGYVELVIDDWDAALEGFKDDPRLQQFVLNLARSDWEKTGVVPPGCVVVWVPEEEEDLARAAR